MSDVVRIQDQLEYGRQYLNDVITSFYNTTSNSIPLINGILKVEYDPILQLGRLKAVVNGEVKTFSFTDPVPSNFLFYSPEDDKIVSTKVLKLDNIEVDKIKEKNLNEGITLESKLIAQDIDAQTITAKNLIIEETINKSTVEYLEIEDKDIILHSGFEGNYENNILGNSRIVVNRGSLDDVYTIWDEIKNRWGITNDGTNVIDLIGINSSGKIRDNLLKEVEFLYNSENNTTPGISIDRGSVSKSTVLFNWNETQEKFNFTDATGNKSLIGIDYTTKEFDTESNILRLKQYENKLEPSIVFDRSYTTSDNATISWDNEVKRFKVVDEYETFYLTKTIGASQEYTVPYTYVSTLGGETSLEIPDTYFVLTDYVFQDSNDKYI
ncbi:MAG: hypothetical protein EOL97_12820, partial [Spirochaetia bacterium]|nr:hypothetical protein [Spirochaetia bacterium]